MSLPQRGPRADEEAAGALARLAGRLETALGVALAGKAHGLAQLQAWPTSSARPWRTRRCWWCSTTPSRCSAPQGAWLDPRWDALVTALVSHEGRGRVVLTPAAPLAGPHGLGVEAVHALGPHEAVLLARELPDLSRMLAGQPGATRAGGPFLVRAVLEATAGTPAVGAGRRPGRRRPVLEAMLATAAEEWERQGVDPSAFLATPATGPTRCRPLWPWCARGPARPWPASTRRRC